MSAVCYLPYIQNCPLAPRISHEENVPFQAKYHNTPLEVPMDLSHSRGPISLSDSALSLFCHHLQVTFLQEQKLHLCKACWRSWLCKILQAVWWPTYLTSPCIWCYNSLFWYYKECWENYFSCNCTVCYWFSTLVARLLLLYHKPGYQSGHLLCQPLTYKRCRKYWIHEQGMCIKKLHILKNVFSRCDTGEYSQQEWNLCPGY